MAPSLTWILLLASITAAEEYRLLEDISRHRPMIPTRAYRDNATAYLFTDEPRSYEVSETVRRTVLHYIGIQREFQFAVVIRQERSGMGTLLALNSGKYRLLDIQSHWKKREIRLSYFVGMQASHLHTERLPYELADGQWHEVALSFSGLRLSMFVDCQRIYVRTLPSALPFVRLVHADRMWIGQRDTTSKRPYFFEGAMESARVIIGAEDNYARQCRDAQPDACPTCSQHLNLVGLVNQLQDTVKNLQKKLHTAEGNIVHLQQCECLRKCRVGNRTYLDGERWAVGKCTDCVCRNGKAVCGEKKCPMLNCKFPIIVESECCPRCSVSCEFRGVVIEHGERKIHKVPNRKVCVICTCEHGGMRCRQFRNMSLICPKLECPLSRQFTTPDDCCNFCPNTDFCLMNPNCDRNAECINLSTKHICKCRPGYRGNGYFCEDINECAEAEAKKHTLCGWNSNCVNNNGSYECRCKAGYYKDNYNLCLDFNECSSGTHSCHMDAECINVAGSHHCRCRPGFLGDGFNCTAQCDGQCQNGGVCSAPNTCKCPVGFTGDRCHIDIDECALGLHKCHINSRCVNLPGSYHCVCRSGFSDNGAANRFGQLCEDIDECKPAFRALTTCNKNMECRNLIGSYECVCRPDKPACSKECNYRITKKHRYRSLKNGARFLDPLQKCVICECQDGVIRCKPLECDCRNELSRRCCNSCKQRKCYHRGRSYKSGVTWTHECSQCHCSDGVRSCRNLLCPSVAHCKKTKTAKGHCCPMCDTDNPCDLPDDLNPYTRGGPGYCDHKGRRYQHNEKWNMADGLCITCQCKFEHICCSRSQQCRTAISTVT